MNIVMPSRCYVEIEYNGNIARFYGELQGSYFAADADSMEWRQYTRAANKEELMRAAFEYDMSLGRCGLVFFDSEGMLNFIPQYWESHGLCLKCGGERRGFFIKRCKRCEGGFIGFILRNMWHFCFLSGNLLGLGIICYTSSPEVFLRFILVSVTFIVIYAVVVIIYRKYRFVRE